MAYDIFMKKAPLKGFTFYLLLFALGLAVFISELDFSIANVAIPSIAAGFGVSPQQGTWVITLFAVSNIIGLALTSRMATRFGNVKVCVWSIALFTFSSFLCGISWDLYSLLFFRMIQGAVTGPLMVLPQTLLLENCAEEKKDMGLSILLLLLVLGPVLGPWVGGWIVEHYPWPWIFYINVPFGILSAMITLGILYNRESIKSKIPVDMMGFIFLAVGLTALQIFLDRGYDEDWFSSNEITTLAVIAGVSLFLCVIWNMYADIPIIDLSFFKDRNFTLGTILISVPYLVISGTTILIPLWLQTQKGYTPYWAGIAVMPLGILPIVIAPLLGLVMGFVSLRFLTAIGFFIFGTTCLWFSNATSEISLWQLFIPRLIQGAGVAFCFLPLFQLTIAYIKEDDLTKATGVFLVMRSIVAGAGIATALYVTVWQQREAVHHSNLTEVLYPLRQPTIEAYEALTTAGVDDQMAAQFFDIIVTNQAYVIAFNDLLWLSGWVLLLTIPFLWLCKERPPGKKLVRAE